MAYKMQTEGAADLERMLKSIGDAAEKVSARGLYEGAGVMADTVQKAAQSIRAEPFHYGVFVQRLPSNEEKAAVMNAKAGIAKFRRDGYNPQTSVGYSRSGYTTIGGKRKAIPLIANAINSGTSFMRKQPFFARAVSHGSRDASDAIVRRIEADIDEIIANGGK